MTLLFNLMGNVGSFTLVKMLVPAFMAILFLQAGFDKVLNYKGNLDYFTDYFKNSPLCKTVGLLMPTITLLEVAAGILSAIGTVALLLGNEILAYVGLMLSATSILCLFFGQRMAKDYGASASMTGYFIAALVGLLMLA
ncbi:MAG: DoxX family protein [Saprospiraceae bacterium]|nr:DoxX family protein [Saprospiraceae bacterium]